MKTKITTAIVALAFSSAVMAAGTDTSTYNNTTTATGTGKFAQAVAANKAGQYKSAIVLLQNVTSTQPRNADAWNELGFALRNVGSYQSSAQAYANALTLNPNHLGALNYQGMLYLLTNQPNKARANAVKLQQLCGNCAEFQSLAQAL